MGFPRFMHGIFSEAFRTPKALGGLWVQQTVENGEGHNRSPPSLLSFLVQE
jgi:hypothetical protein